MRKQICWLLSGIFMVLFVVWTAIVKFVDVQTGGDSQTQIGLGHMNLGFYQAVGTSKVWQTVTKLLGYLVIALMVGLVVWQIVIMFRQRSWHLHKHWLVLDAIIVGVILIYFLFELLAINHRPVLVDGKLGASYPSSHVLLFTVFIPLAILTFWREIPHAPVNIVLTVGLSIVLVFGVLGRTLCGLHWLSDVIASLILSSALICTDLALTFE